MALNLSTETDVHSGGAGPGGKGASKPPAAAPLPPAEVAKLFPQLEILEFLGRGGMGAVYKARQPRLDRVVALKILSPEKQGDPHFAERFEREARTLARLNHPNIVAVYDFGEVRGHFHLLMEFVDGLTLRQLYQTRKLAPEEALSLVPEICQALQYAHERGIVHRDIKPENILLDKQGRVKIADFGIAKILGQAAQAGLTQEKQIIGTPQYMAPEQVEKPQTVDHRADIFSLGVVFYEMLTGELPLGRFAAPSRMVRLDIRLDEVVLRALEKEPERRYQQATQLQAQVETIASSNPYQSAAGSEKGASTTQASGSPGGAGLVAETETPKVRPVFRRAAAIAGGGFLLALAIKLFVAAPPGDDLDELRTGSATAAELADVARGKVAVPRRTVVPIPSNGSGGVAQTPGPPFKFTGPLIEVEAYLAEVPANFQPTPGSMDHNSLRRQHGVRVLNAPHLVVPSGTSAELEIGEIAVIKEARSFTFRVLPSLERGRILYQLDISDSRREPHPQNDGQVTSLQTAKNFNEAGAAELGEPRSFDLGILENGRRLVGFVVFRLGGATTALAGDPSMASISNPEFQQVLSMGDADANGMVFFDFETGRALKPPVPISFDPDDPTRLNFSAGLREWVKQENMDVLFVLRDRFWHAISLDLEERNLTTALTLDAFKPQEFESLIAPLKGYSGTADLINVTASVYYIPYDDTSRSPSAAFCTRTGTKGLFKWTSVRDPMPGIKVRYRFWRK